MGLVKRWVSAFLAGAVVFCGMPVQAQAAPEIVAGNYEIDMERIPQVHFAVCVKRSEIILEINPSDSSSVSY